MGRRGPKKLPFNVRAGPPCRLRQPRQGSLDGAGLSATTLDRYLQQFLMFLGWCFQAQQFRAESCVNSEQLDLLLADYIRHLFSAGEAEYRGVYALCAVKALDITVYAAPQVP